MRSIDIQVTTQLVPEQTEADKNHYVFAYTIEISNRGEPPCQLLNRHWVITNGLGEVEEVRGAGVVGQQPRLCQGESFRYTSGAILKTPVGTMQGSYEFCYDTGERFEVPIPVFSLSIPNLIH